MKEIRRLTVDIVRRQREKDSCLARGIFSSCKETVRGVNKELAVKRLTVDIIRRQREMEGCLERATVSSCLETKDEAVNFIMQKRKPTRGLTWGTVSCMTIKKMLCSAPVSNIIQEPATEKSDNIQRIRKSTDSNGITSSQNEFVYKEMLALAKSRITKAEMGVHLRRPVKKGRSFGQYGGGSLKKKLTDNQIDLESTDVEYVLSFLSKGHMVNVSGKSHWSGYINHQWGSKSNITLDETGYLIAKEDINASPNNPIELYIDYGIGYWCHKVFGQEFTCLPKNKKRLVKEYLHAVLPNLGHINSIADDEYLSL
jgi:uncharacterized protein YwbE